MPTKAPVHQVRRVSTGAVHKDAAQARAIEIRNSKRWQDTRKSFSEHPDNVLCRDPYGQHKRDGRTVLGTQVHHIQPLIKRPDLAFDWSNLANLCGDCHARIELTERRGVTTYHLFVLPKGDGA